MTVIKRSIKRKLTKLRLKKKDRNGLIERKTQKYLEKV